MELLDTQLKCNRCDASLEDPSEMLNLINNQILCCCCATEVSWQTERDVEASLYNEVQ